MSSPEEAVLSGRHAEVLKSALNHLGAEDRLVLVCRYLLELTERETAEVLGRPVGTIKSKSARALARLRTLLQDSEPAGALDE